MVGKDWKGLERIGNIRKLLKVCKGKEWKRNCESMDGYWMWKKYYCKSRIFGWMALG